MPSTQLASYSNLALYSAMGVYTLAMVLFAVYLASLGPAPARRRTAVTEPARELVAADGSTISDLPTDLPTGPPTGPPTGLATTGHEGAGAAGGDAGAPDSLDLLDPPGRSTRSRQLAGIGLSLSWLATALLVGAVVLRGFSVMRPPWGNMFEFACAGAAVAALLYLVLARRNHWEWLGLFVIGPVLLALGLAVRAFYTPAAELMPALQSVWLVIHVTVAIAAVGVFVISAAVGSLYLARDRREQHPPKRANFIESLPPATKLERSTYSLTMVGFILWTFTLVAGAIWAQKAWGSYWTWDPKEVWTFVVWVVYAAYMHARATAGWEPRRATWIALAGFVCVVLNFTVVNLYMSGMHSYSGL